MKFIFIIFLVRNGSNCFLYKIISQANLFFKTFKDIIFYESFSNYTFFYINILLTLTNTKLTKNKLFTKNKRPN
ncbi:hypothetical protein FPG3_07445 [Flavobacterium psychrophilum FPG3]|nr:hypothetical protein FPG3_07445 [Flavobacterium psychrophilum FPG3]OXB12501.1 hypothetical protein B0A57_05650 [Flavobacterium psychrophilum DSM 3660 = ATCC 49418]